MPYDKQEFVRHIAALVPEYRTNETILDKALRTLNAHGHYMAVTYVRGNISRDPNEVIEVLSDMITKNYVNGDVAEALADLILWIDNG